LGAGVGRLCRPGGPAGGSNYPFGRRDSRGATRQLLAVNSIVLVAQDGQVVCERCELADGFFDRGRGLLGRAGLERGHGMLIRPTWSVHTAFMRFEIDVLFLDHELTVVGVKRRLRSWRIAARRGAHSALELAAGESERLSIEVGDRLAWGALGAEA
jgi:uncharacterized membrane protein (UPF0127 family)